MILASVIFPVTVMFFATGALYLLDIKPTSEQQEYRSRHSEPIPDNHDQLKAIALQKLDRLGLSKPLGKSRLKWNKKRQGYFLDWRGRNFNLTLRASTQDQHVAVLKVYTPSLYNQFMRLHKGHGKDLFDIFVIVSAIIMLLILLSGTVIGLGIPKFRRLVLYSMGFGSLLFVGLMIYSQYI